MRVLPTPSRIASRIVSISALVILLAVVANAYTVIMHGGRRVEIPTRFIVTPVTLTYEVSEGIQVTIPIAAIDIAATEKANNELPGSLLHRSTSRTVEPLSTKDGNEKQRSGARRTITNSDLDTLRRRRLDSETAYASQRKQLGLPSLEESRKLEAARFDLVTAELAQKRIVEKQSEDYWRQRATALRTEIVALDAELNYVRTRLEEMPFGTSIAGSSGSFTSIGAIVGFGFRGNSSGRSFGNFSNGRSSHGQMIHRPNVYRAPAYGPQIRARVGYGGGVTRGQVFVNPGRHRNLRPMGSGVYFGPFPNTTVLGSSVQGYDFTYERSELITRFNELAAARAGLNARWRELEDEARRAGVAPGWLRR